MNKALKRDITPGLLLFFIIGDMVGGGIYALVGEVAETTGGAIWSAFAVALLLALFTAFAYAELVTKYPEAGGAAAFVDSAFNLPLLTFLVAFAVAMSGLASASALSLAFAGDYLQVFLDIPRSIAALIFIMVVAVINYRGIKVSLTLNAILTFVELGGLLLIIVIGLTGIVAGTSEPARAFEFKPGSSIGMSVLAGAVLSFYALIGFEDSVNVAEETQNPSRIYPRILFGGILITGAIYLVVTFIASAVVPTDDLIQSTGPLLEVVDRSVFNVPPKLFAAIALFALSNGALINMIMASRLLYGMGNRGIMPKLFAHVHPRQRTPWVAIIFTTAISAVLIWYGEIDTLANTTVLLLLIVFTMVNVSVLVLRKDTVQHEHFVSPKIFPVIGIGVCCGMLTQQITEAWINAGVLLLIGIALFGVNKLLSKPLSQDQQVN